jgi:hypothetical protein
MSNARKISRADSVSLSDEKRAYGGKALPGVSRPPAKGFMIISATPCRLARGKISVLLLGIDSNVTPEIGSGKYDSAWKPRLLYASRSASKTPDLISFAMYSGGPWVSP